MASARAADDAAALAGALPLVSLTDVLAGVATAGQDRLEGLGEELAGLDDGERCAGGGAHWERGRAGRVPVFWVCAAALRCVR